MKNKFLAPGMVCEFSGVPFEWDRQFYSDIIERGIRYNPEAPNPIEDMVSELCHVADHLELMS